MITKANPTKQIAVPEYAAGYMTEADTLAELRKVRPSLHRTTLIRMRQKRQIQCVRFGSIWYYKPESVFANPTSVLPLQ